MPYASSIQVVNDANGVAHGFLADNGAIWQCQWDPQAQVWTQGQLVPEAYGGEKLQALYLDQLWPASSNNPKGLSPGIVLAYRVGEGRSAEIFASFGQWGSNGELGWSSPLQLTQDQLDEVAFALVPAEEADGGFSLVVQKRQGDTPAGTLLDQLGSASSEELPAKLEATLSGSRPDSDLYVTQFNLEASESTSAWAELSIPGTSFSESITAAPPQVNIAAAPAPFAGHTQLSRQQLSANATQPPSTALMSSSSEGTSGGDNSQQSANYSGKAAYTFSKGGQWRTGMISGSNLTSWSIEIPFDKKEAKNDQRPFRITSKGKVYGGIAGGTATAVNPGSNNHFGPQFRWEGSFGIRNIGAGLTSVNTMKMSVGVGNDNEKNSDRIKAIAENGGGSDVTGYVGLGGMLSSYYSYQGGNDQGVGGLKTNISLNPSQKLQQILTEESVGIDSLLRFRYIAPGGNSVKLILSDFIGYMWSQQVTNNGDIPSWIADLGYYSGMVGNAEKMGKAAYAVGNLMANQFISFTGKHAKTPGERAADEENSGIGDQDKKGFEYLNWINAIYGTTLAVTTPVALSLIKGLEIEKSSGIQNETEMIFRFLWHSVAGVELKLSNTLHKFLKGAEKGSLDDYLYVAAGAALPLGGFLPLLSYYHAFEPGADPGGTEGDSSVKVVNPSNTTEESTQTNITVESTPTSTTAYIPAPSGNAYPFTYGPSSANNLYLGTSDQSSQSIPLASPLGVAGFGGLGASSAWSPLGSQSTPATPALARIGNTVYIAVQGKSDNYIHWNSSSDGGLTWSTWQQLPTGMTSVLPPSLAVVGGTLYLSYLGDGNNEINITKLVDASSNSWSNQYVIPGKSATYASLIAETVGEGQNLTVYYVSNDSADLILKTTSATPASPSGWSSSTQIEYKNSSEVQTASGPLAVTSYNGQTYIAYQGGTTASPSDRINIASSAGSSSATDGVYYPVQAPFTAASGSGLGLTNSANGLILSYGNASSPNALQFKQLSEQAGKWVVTDSYSKPISASLSNDISILSLDGGNGPALVLAGVNTAASGYGVATSVLATKEIQSASLKKLTLNTYNEGLNSASASASGSLPLTLVNAGTGLKDGTYTDVAILGVTISGGLKDAALADFTVSGGSINPESFQISRAGSYLALPEASSASPASYALLLDVFTTGIANPPDSTNSTGGNPFADLPLITVAAGASNSPLAIQSIQSIQTVNVSPASQPSGVVYPQYDPKTVSTQPQPANNNATYVYSDVAVNLLNAATQQVIDPLNSDVTATVYLNAGLIQQVVLSQPLLFIADTSSAASAPNSFSIQLQLPVAVVNSLPANTAQPSFAVSPQSLALNNFVEDEQFSGQSGAANAGVYLSAGLSDQLPLYSSMGAWPVQNRVTYVASSVNGQVSPVYLNGLLKSAGGGFAPEPATTAAELSLSEIYTNHDILFTAASTPTAATIAGPASTPYANKTFVAWVEASNPVIPISTDSGADNFQAYMEAFYGNQRINYRINTSGTTWLAPELAGLYHPNGAIINHLQAVNVADPAAAGQERTLLVWSETSMAAIKGEVESFGSSGLNTTPIPTTLKAAWLNPNPKSYQWNDLFADSNGNSTIQSIPWNPTSEVGLGIDDISIASLPLLSAGAANGSLSESPVISWSQDVRTPYTQSVLNDNPSIYLKFDQLQAGVSAINIGTTKNSSTTATSASATGLNFAIQGALPASQATAVQNSDGTGVLATGMGTINRSVSQILDNIPADDLNDIPDPIALFTGSITGTLLTVTSLSQGSLAVGDVISGEGIVAGTIITAITPGNPSDGTGSYTLNTSQPQPVTSTSLISTPNVGVCSFTGSIVGTELTVTSLTQGNLHVGDVISGQGIADGTIITAINPTNPSNGTGLFTVNKSQTETISSAGLVASPGLPTVPYTIEFWAQLQPDLNPDGAGLVALGQPSDGAIGAPSLPEGWLLTSSFVVDQITYNEAAARGLIEAIPSTVIDPGEAIYGWGWAVLAEGANATAMNGNGGSNLYSNAVQINNFVSGSQLAGVNSFLQAYSLSSSELIGLNGTNAATIAQVPTSQLQFTNAIDPVSQLPNSSLNAIALDTNSAVLNQGMVLAGSSLSPDLQTMFDNLWQFQLKTGEAKVNFSLSPTSTPTPSPSSAPPSELTSENYSGYALDFSLSRGTAVSVNGKGELVFDVAAGTSLTSSAVGTTIPKDLRDGQWHYIVASYLPTYQTYNVEGNITQLPSSVGTATLYIDNKLVASNANILGAYAPINPNDQALLLANNAGGAIDQLAFYDKALTSVDFKANTSGQWPAPSAADALGLLSAAGYGIANQTPDLGTKPGAVNAHWYARNVNPNDALLGTYYSTFTPDGNGGGSWTQASNLNPSPTIQATLPSAAPSKGLQDVLLITVPSTVFTANPANDELTGVTVTLTNNEDNSKVTLQLTPEQVLLGGNSLKSLQPFATAGNFHYTVLSDSPVFSLVIQKDQLPRSASSANPDSSYADQYTADYSFTFVDQSSGSQPVPYVASGSSSHALNQNASDILSSNSINQGQLTKLQKRNQALATAAVIEQAPLQLKYVDSGEILKSSSSAAASSESTASPAPSFGTSQVVGSFPSTDVNSPGLTNGWLAIAQPQSINAASNPAGRIWIQYTGQYTVTTTNGITSSKASTSPAQAPITWLNALAQSNFSPDAPNLPLLGAANNPSSSGGLLIQADPTVGWGENFGQTMLVADVNDDGVDDLVIAAPQANGGGRVYIIDGNWIAANLTTANGNTILNLANPNGIGNYVTVLAPSSASSPDNSTEAGFGSALAYNSSSKTLWIGAPNYLSQLNLNPATVNVTLASGVSSWKYSTNGGASFTEGVGTSFQLAQGNYSAGSIQLQQSTLASDLAAITSVAALNCTSGSAYTFSGLTGGLTTQFQQANSIQPIGALYSYSASTQSWGTGVLNQLQNPITGNGGSATSLNLSGSPITTYWGSQFGSAIAVDSTSGVMAVSAPGVYAAMVYSGTQGVQEQVANGSMKPSDTYGDGALIRIQLPGSDNQNSVSIANGPTGTGLIDIVNKSAQKPNKADETTYMQNLKALQVDTIAKATVYNNQALQVNAVGAVYLFDASTTTPTPETANSTYYGPNPWNVLGASGFGSSLAFSDLTNSNDAPILAIGADQTGGSGAVYFIDTNSQPNSNLGGTQYLAHLVSGLTLYGAEAHDQFGNGLVSLGDVNNDSYDDLLIQAYNAGSSAGNGYVLFGSDNLVGPAGVANFNPGTGNVAPGSIGDIKQPSGPGFKASILSELGYGLSSNTGQGAFGAGDINGDGLYDIPLGSGPNGSAYLTWGQPYLEAITSLQLDKLASNTGYTLDGLATSTQGSLRSIGDFNGDGYGDFISIQPGLALTTVRIELGANTQEVLADYLYNDYFFTVSNGTQVSAAGDINGDGFSDLALLINQDLSPQSQGAGSTLGILYGRPSDELPVGSGFGYLSPVNQSSQPLIGLPGLEVSGGLSDAQPAVISVGNDLYAVVKGDGATSLWFAQSSDAGQTWTGWTNLTATQSGLASNFAPSLAYFNNKLYLAFLNTDDTPALSISSWDPSSNTPVAWRTPTALSDGNASTSFSSRYSPQLIDRVDALGVFWVDATTGTLSASYSTTPDQATALGGLGAPTPWSPLDGGSSPARPALARIDNTVYMAVQGNGDNYIYWNSSSDGGVTWGSSWNQLPTAMTTANAPSLTVVNGVLYLSYLGYGNNGINITSLVDASSNSWSNQYVIPGQSATYASLVAETAGTGQQLAVYYVSNDSTDRILKAYSTTPGGSTATGWTADVQIQYNNTTGVQTASGPLAVTTYENQTYIAYLGGTTASPSNTIYVTTSAGSSAATDGTYFPVQSTFTAASGSGLGLTNAANGLILSYTKAGSPNTLQLKQLSPQAGQWVTTDSYVESLPTSLSSDVSILSLDGDSGPGLVLAGINTSGSTSGYGVQTSLLYPVNSDSSWNTPRQLLERVAVNGTTIYQPIVATAAPSLTWLGQDAVVAVNNSGTVNVYGAIPSSLSWQLASSFTAASGSPQISTAPVLATTDTGLALTYGTSDGAINLNRLNLLNNQGALLADPQPWSSTVLNQANGGLTSNLATVPLSVDGNLLLTSVLNANSEIWLNVVPDLGDPQSVTWLNTTVQLGSSLSQRAGSDNTIGDLVAGTWSDTNIGGATPSLVSFASYEDTIYAAVEGTGANNLWFNISKNNGEDWTGWAELPSGMGTYEPVSIAYYQGMLYLCYIAAGSNNLNLTWYDGADGKWASQVSVNGIDATSASMIVEGDNLAIYYTNSSSDILKTYTSTTSPSSNSDWTNTEVYYSDEYGDDFSQTASSNLALTRFNGQTYLAYQGGTSSSPSTEIYIYTAIDSVSNSTSSPNWTELSTPASISPNGNGIGLTSNDQGLILTYTDTTAPDQVSIQMSNLDVSTWRYLENSQVLSSSVAYTPFVTSSPATPLLIAGVDTNGDIYVQQNQLPVVLSTQQTGSSISAVGDINGDGMDDLLVTANNVAFAQNGDLDSTDAQLVTGVRFVLGAGTPQALTTNNSVTVSEQTVQIAAPSNNLSLIDSSTPVATLNGSGQLSLNSVTGSYLNQISSTAPSPLSSAVITASSANLASVQQLFANARVDSLTSLTGKSANLSGSLALQTLGGYGDLNGDGSIDYLAADGLHQIATAGGGTTFYSLWSIRAAGDVNGNGVDDVLLSLVPQGPAYVPNQDGTPSAIESVLVDGSLFKVDPTTNTFSLGNLRSPLDPYNKGEIYDVNSTSNSQYLPLLQNWFDPILFFEPGTLSGASVGTAAGVGGAKTLTPPAAVVDELGNASLIFPGYTSGSGIWMATLSNSTGAWSQFQLTSSNATSTSNMKGIDYLKSPSAVFYEGSLYLAYVDSSGSLYIAFTKAATNGQPADYSTADWTAYQVITTNASNQQVDESSRYSPALAVEEGRLALYFASNNGASSSNDQGVTQQLRYLYSNNPDAKTPSWGISQASGSSANTTSSTPAPYVGESTTLNFASGTSTDQYACSSGITATTYQGKTVLAFTGNGGGAGNNEYVIRLATAPSANPGPSEDWLYWSSGQSTNYQYGYGSIGLTTDQSLLYVTPASGYQKSQVYALSPVAATPGSYSLSSGYAGPDSLSGYGNPTIFMQQGTPMLAWANNSNNLQTAELTLTVGAPNQQSLAGYSLDGNIDVNGDGFTDILLSDPSDHAMGVDNQYVLFGGDYLNIASQVGTAGNDTLIGTPLVDVIYTLSGADEVQSKGGADVIYTGSGDDQISIADNAFVRIDAGSGFDQLRLQGQAGQSYDFTLSVATPQYFVGTKLKDIELISSVDYGSNILSFDAAAINAINPDRILFLSPDSADFINLSAEFDRSQSFDTNYGGSLWYAYVAGGGAGGSTNPTLAYVRVPDGETASTWLGSQVSVAAQTSALLQINRLADPTQAIEPIQATDAIEPTTIPLDIIGPFETTFLWENADPLASSPQQDGSDPVTTSLPLSTATDSSFVPAATPSMVAGSNSFGDGLTITAYRTSPDSGLARFRISRSGDLSRSQLISYVSSSLNSSAEPGRHYTPVAGLLRLEAGQDAADITVPVDGAAIAALRNGTLSLQVAELDDLGQKQVHLLLDVAPTSAGLRPVLSGLNLQVDDSGMASSIGFRADINQAASAKGLFASTLNLQVLRRQSGDSSATDPKTRVQNLVISEGVLTKFDQDGLDNDQVELQFSLDATKGSIQLQAANPLMQSLVLSKLDPARKSITVGIDLTTTSLEAVLPMSKRPDGVVLNETAVDFTIAADASGRSKLFLDLTQVGDDLVISEGSGATRKRKLDTQLIYYGINADGSLSPWTYNAKERAGARFYDTNGDGIADFVSLSFVDGGIGDTGPIDGTIHDPSTAGVVNLADVELSVAHGKTLLAASKSNQLAPASLVVRADLKGRAATANQIGYVVLDATDTQTFEDIFGDLKVLRSRAQTLFSTLESSDVMLASDVSLSREILLVNGQSVRFFEVEDGDLDHLSADNKDSLRILTSVGQLNGAVEFTSLSGVTLSLALITDRDQGLNALIGQEQGLAPVLDFTGFSADQQVAGSYSLAREASFDAVTGFYRALDINGTVWLDPTDPSKGTITPGQEGTTAAAYGAAALNNMVDSLTGLRVGNRQTSAPVAITLQESTYLAPIAQVNGNTFVAYAQGNQDGIAHFVSLGTCTFGLEDLLGGGDRDFDDQVIGLLFRSVTTVV